MRQAGTVKSEADARRFADYLLTQGIAAHIDEDTDGWAIWIRDENQLEEAKKHLADFLYDPQNPRYREATGQAAEIRRQTRRNAEEARKNIVHMRGRWDRGVARRAPLTFTAIAICVAVFILTDFGAHNSALLGKLEFTDPVHLQNELADVDILGNRWDRLIDIRHGEVWRLITPNYLHLGILHLVFNMYWLYRFGAEIESRRGSLYLMVMLVVIGVISNVAQALIESPFGGGMSGVVYGLFGYTWMKSVYDPGAGFQVSKFTVAIFVIWFFLCLSNRMGPIANTAHGAGLVLGVIWGYLPILLQPTSRGP